MFTQFKTILPACGSEQEKKRKKRPTIAADTKNCLLAAQACWPEKGLDLG